MQIYLQKKKRKIFVTEKNNRFTNYQLLETKNRAEQINFVSDIFSLYIEKDKLFSK